MGSLTAPGDQGDCPLECEDEAFWTCEWLACHEHGVVRSAFVEWCEMVWRDYVAPDTRACCVCSFLG